MRLLRERPKGTVAIRDVQLRVTKESNSCDSQVELQQPSSIRLSEVADTSMSVEK